MSGGSGQLRPPPQKKAYGSSKYCASGYTFELIRALWKLEKGQKRLMLSVLNGLPRMQNPALSRFVGKRTDRRGFGPLVCHQ
jgi:hypothetical protein